MGPKICNICLTLSATSYQYWPVQGVASSVANPEAARHLFPLPKDALLKAIMEVILRGNIMLPQKMFQLILFQVGCVSVP